jgi:L-ascorbate metabolism protein UlaG (beta-lactamase superfamily)
MKKIAILLIIIGGVLVMIMQCAQSTSQNSDGREKMNNSENYKNGKFQNPVPTTMIAKGKYWQVTKEYLSGGQEHRKPESPLPVALLTNEDFHNPPSQELRLIWLGHSTILIEFEGKRYLLDPVFSQRSSPVQWIGPKRFQPVPLGVEDVPALDAVIISHNHYDHLDKSAVRKLADKTKAYYVPLGIGKILESWGIDSDKISESDWWDEIVQGQIKFVCTPARHFSGRGLFDRNETLWCSWAIIGQKSRIYFSGDTGMFAGFSQIGEMYGPFDVTFLKIGAYNKAWPDIHLNPEEAVQAHIQLKGQQFIPIHWGTFDLGLHSWYEPVERLTVAAEKANIRFSIPQQGEIISPPQFGKDKFWWKQILVQDSSNVNR